MMDQGEKRDYEGFPSYEEFLESSHRNRDLYQTPPRQHKTRHHHRKLKVDLPPFLRKESVDDYLDWEM